MIKHSIFTLMLTSQIAFAGAMMGGGEDDLSICADSLNQTNLYFATYGEPQGMLHTPEGALVVVCPKWPELDSSVMCTTKAHDTLPGPSPDETKVSVSGHDKQITSAKLHVMADHEILIPLTCYHSGE